jgi:hypothetical protein
LTRTIRIRRRWTLGFLVAPLLAVILTACGSSNPEPYELTDSVIASLECEATRTVSNRLNALQSDIQVPANRNELELWLPDNGEAEKVISAVNDRRRTLGCDSTSRPYSTSTSSTPTSSPATVADCDARFIQVDYENNPENRMVPNGIAAKTPEESRAKDFAAMGIDARNLALTAKLLGLWQTANPEGLVREDGNCLSPEGAKLYDAVITRLTESGTILAFGTPSAKWYNTGIDGDIAIVAEKPGFTGDSKALVYELPDGIVVAKLLRSGNLAYPPDGVEDISPGDTDNPKPKKATASPTAAARSTSAAARTSSARAQTAPTSASSPRRSASASPTASVAPAQPVPTKAVVTATPKPATATPTVVPNTTSTTTIPAPG